MRFMKRRVMAGKFPQGPGKTFGESSIMCAGYRRRKGFRDMGNTGETAALRLFKIDVLGGRGQGNQRWRREKKIGGAVDKWKKNPGERFVALFWKRGFVAGSTVLFSHLILKF